MIKSKLISHFKIKLSFLLYLNFSFFVAVSQNPIIDSLRSLLEKDKKIDTVRIRRLYDLERYTALYLPQRYGENIVEIERASAKLNYTKGEMMALELRSNVAKESGNLKEALKYGLSLISKAESIDDDVSVWYGYMRVGQVYMSLKEPELAQQYYQKAYHIAVKKNNKMMIAQSLRFQGLAYVAQKKLQDALKVNFEALKNVPNNEREKAQIYNNIALCYENLDDYENALGYYKKAAQINEQLKYLRSLEVNYSNIGNILIRFKKYDEAEHYLNQGFNLLNKEQKPNVLAYYEMFRSLYIEKKDIQLIKRYILLDKQGE